MTYSYRAKELANTLRENAEANIRRNMTCAITDKDLDMNPEEESAEEFLARKFYPDNGYEPPIRFRNAFVRGYRHASETISEDERITAWDRIARHPFFNAAFDDTPGPLIDSMIELLDKAVSLPSKGENMNYNSHPDAYGEYLSVGSEEGRVLFGVSDSYGSLAPCYYLTLKDVAALHKALGDHLAANRRELPREGAVRFSGGQIAVYSPESSEREPTFLVHHNGKAGWYAERELERNFGTDWEELVVK